MKVRHWFDAPFASNMIRDGLRSMAIAVKAVVHAKEPEKQSESLAPENVLASANENSTNSESRFFSTFFAKESSIQKLKKINLKNIKSKQNLKKKLSISRKF